MADVTVNRTVNAPVADVWAAWDDFGAIERFNPNLKASYLIGDSADQGPPTGVGATRQCDLKDGRNHIRERIVDYAPERRMVVDIYDGTMPLESATATITFEPTAAERTRVTMRMDFRPKFGPLGTLMVPMMKPQFRRMLQGLLDANAAFVERGEEVQRVA